MVQVLAQADNGDILAAPFSRSDAEADMFEGIGTEAARLAYKDIADHQQVNTPVGTFLVKKPWHHLRAKLRVIMRETTQDNEDNPD